MEPMLKSAAPAPAEPEAKPQAPGAEAQAPDDNAEQNPAYRAAIEYAMQALYGAEAAREVAQAIKSAPDPVEALSSTAYEMVTVVDERTEGQVPDELLVSLASEVLGEVAEIAQAGGVDVKPDMVAAAMRDMILRFVTEQGGDITQLQQAMGQVDPAQLTAALGKVEG